MYNHHHMPNTAAELYLFARIGFNRAPSIAADNIHRLLHLPIHPPIPLSISSQIPDIPSIYPAALPSISTSYPSYIFPSHLPSIHSFNHLLGFHAAQSSIKEHGMSRRYIRKTASVCYHQRRGKAEGGGMSA